MVSNSTSRRFPFLMIGLIAFSLVTFCIGLFVGAIGIRYYDARMSPVAPVVQSSPRATRPPPPVPGFKKWTSQNVVAVFQEAGLEIENPRAITKEDYGLAPMVADEGTRFLIPSLCADCGARIFSFKTSADLAKMKTYYESMPKASAVLFSHVFVKDNILIQINGDLPDDAANAYRDALENLK